MNADTLRTVIQPALDDLTDRSMVAERFVDKNVYRLSAATLWANVVLDPSAIGIEEADLETLHDIVNEHVTATLGRDEDLTNCFRYINSKAGERAMQEARMSKNHKDLLLYFASMILDPDGHKRWMDHIKESGDLPRY